MAIDRRRISASSGDTSPRPNVNEQMFDALRGAPTPLAEDSRALDKNGTFGPSPPVGSGSGLYLGRPRSIFSPLSSRRCRACGSRAPAPPATPPRRGVLTESAVVSGPLRHELDYLGVRLEAVRHMVEKSPRGRAGYAIQERLVELPPQLSKW